MSRGWEAVPSSVEVYQVVFDSHRFAYVATFLQLTPLDGTGLDYTIGLDHPDRAFSRTLADMARARGYDSYVQLYKEKPEEAQWIPQLHTLFTMEANNA